MLEVCLDHVLRHATGSFRLVVSSDEADNPDVARICRERNVPLLAGPNRGVVWNKNRALYYFMSRTVCDPIILLEDDALPTNSNWLDQWAEATQRWDHVNYSHPGILATSPGAVGGSGTPQDPHVTVMVTGQCTSSSRRSLKEVGYLDPRFSGYGYGHAEWSIRNSKMLHPDLSPPPPHQDVFYSIHGGIRVLPSESFRTDDQLSRNLKVLLEIRRETPGYRDPWIDEAERRELELQVAAIEQQGARPARSPAGILGGSLKVQAAVPSETLAPMMTEHEANCLRRHLSQARILVEFGCGGSTLLALDVGLRWTVSVESDLAWIRKLRQRKDIVAAEKGGRLAFIHADIGPVQSLGTPKDDSRAIQWPRYYRDVWTKIDAATVDAGLVDGRFRVACALTAMMNCLMPIEIIVHDFWDRPHYHVLTDFADVVDSEERLVVLRRKDAINWRDFGRALLDHSLDHR